MFKKLMHIFMLAVMLAGLFALNPATLARAATLTVTNTNDSGAGSLRQAITDAVSGDTINFSVTGTITLSSSITINKDLTISGPGVDQLNVSGGGTTRVFNISGGVTVNLSGFSIKNGITSQNGGGIYIILGTLNINNMLFENNIGSVAGGAIASASNSTIAVTISNSTFKSNSLSSSGGGGAIGIQYHQQLAMTNVIFEGNSAGFGGAVALLNNSTGTSEINTWEDVIFLNNSATSAGGGAYIDNGNVIIKNSTFYLNTAATESGGLSIDGYLGNTVSLRNVTISGNSVTAGRAGGLGIYNSTVTVNLNNVTVANNTSTTNAGGVFSSNSSATININNSIVSDNTSGANPDCNLIMDSGDYNLINNISGCTLPGSATHNITAQPANLIVIDTFPNGQMAHAIGNTSPALDSGNNATCETEDQRSILRPQDGNNDTIFNCDMGAYEHEFDNIPPTVASIALAESNPTSATSVNFTVTFSEPVTGVDANGSDFTVFTSGVINTSIASVTPITNSVYTVTVNTGSGNGVLRLDIPDTSTIKDLSNNDLAGLPFTNGESYSIDKDLISLPTGWLGSVSISSDKNVVAVGRPHIGSEIASYDSSPSGALSAYVPMLFKDAFGGSYDAALYVQNVSGSSANITIKFYDSSGSLSCTKNDTVSSLASKGYWLPSESCLPAGWVGGALVTSDQNIATIGRPHIGAEVMTYNGFSSGSTSTSIPMLFKDAFGGSYDAAFYIQNIHPSNTANLTINFYDSSGALSCTKNDTLSPLASKGYWVPAQSCLPAGWVGGVIVTSDQPIVSVGRPHIGSQITTYNGFSSGSTSSFIPMLFKDAFGGSYDSAFYLQNTHSSNTANLTIQFYDSAGTLSCTKNDTLAPFASKGFWVPAESCLPAGWVGGVIVTSDQPIVGVGRPHIGAQITTYNGFSSGSSSSFLSMLFKDAFGGSYDSAFYIQNTEASQAAVTTSFYDSAGALTCSRTDTIQPKATLGIWVPSASCVP